MGLARFIAGAFSRFSKRSSASFSGYANAEQWLGAHGERLAAKHLRRNGYKVLYRNFRARRGGEVDIVCRERKTTTLVFVEVKTRRTLAYGTPASAVNPDKQKLIARGAVAWLRMLDYPEVRFRFDIVEVLVNDSGETLNIVRDAFHLPDAYTY